MNILFIGDVFGSPGRKIIKEILPSYKRERKIDYCIANAENAAGGSGINYVIAKGLYESGVDFITMGNHTWARKEIHSFIDSQENFIRPANYPPSVPGKGYEVVETLKGKVAVINLMGRVFMDAVDCPFRKADEILLEVKKHTNIIIVDFHAEATSEKIALVNYLDGRVSAVIGTHTHVQTADEQILERGTGFISDVGMTGPKEGIIGVQKEIVLDKFLKGYSSKFEVAKGSMQLNALEIEIEEVKGRTVRIERVKR